MKTAAQNLDFERATEIRDLIKKLKSQKYPKGKPVVFYGAGKLKLKNKKLEPSFTKF